jgi:cullin-associated NEDD8-dissociated protein 1
MRPLDQESGMFLGNYDYSAHVVPLYDAIHPRLEEHDIDQEIKECAIATVGTLVATAGDDLADDVPEVLALLLDRMSNEITRVHVLKALTLLANSSLTLDLSSVLDDAVRQLADFLKQQNRPLKQTALETLSALVSSDGKSMKPALLQLVLGETAPLVSSSDLHLAHLALQVDIGIVHASKAKGIAKAIETALLAPLLELAASPLLQGAALSSLLTFLQELLGLKVSRGGVVWGVVACRWARPSSAHPPLHPKNKKRRPP